MPAGIAPAVIGFLLRPSTMLELSADDRARWAPVISHLKHQLVPLKSAHDVEDARRLVMDTATQLMSELFADWNESTITCRLPPEVLALCFSFLSLGHLLSATHVCRSWRETALASPALWSTLTFDNSSLCDASILSIALARAGQTALNLKLHSIPREQEEAVGIVLSRHMPRIQHLSFTVQSMPSFLLEPAPVLQSLALQAVGAMPDGFLGGTPRCLQTLSVTSLSLPASNCPALSTVTTLTVIIRHHNTLGDTQLAHLFSVCPRVEHLRLIGLARRHSPQMFAGTPTRLRSLTLRALEADDFDLVRYLCAWEPSNPNLASIDLAVDANVGDAEPVLADVQVLSVVRHGACATLQADNARGRRCTLLLQNPSQRGYNGAADPFAGFLCDNRPLLRTLRSLTAPATLLGPLFSTPPEMPRLRVLNVVVEKWAPAMSIMQRMYHDVGYGAVFPCEQLVCLLGTEGMQLERVEILACSSIVPLDATDVQNLLEALASFLPPRTQRDAVEILLDGVPDDLAAGIALPSVQGYSLGMSPSAP